MPHVETILVIEYGKIEGTVGYYDPEEDGAGATRLVINSPPIESINNRSATVILGMTVGGSSAVNGQFFDRGSRFDYDEWARLGSPEFDDQADTWDWENLYAMFQKACAFDPFSFLESYLHRRPRAITLSGGTYSLTIA